MVPPREVHMAEMVVGEYAQGAISGNELQQAIDTAMEEVLTDPAALGELARHGIDEQALRNVTFSVEQKPGLGPAAVLIQISIQVASTLTAGGITALWVLVLRRVKQRKGHDAVGPESAPKSLSKPPNGS
jgi:hypothetical protein